MAGSGGSGGSEPVCPAFTGDEAWVDGEALPGGNGTQACPAATIQAGISLLFGRATAVVHVKSGAAYQGGFTVPPGFTVIGDNVGTLIRGAAGCGDDTRCVVAVSKSGRLENFNIAAEDTEHGVQLRGGGNPALSQVQVRGGSVGILVQGAAELGAGVEATDSAGIGMRVDVEEPAVVRFTGGYYSFARNAAFGIHVSGDATIDMSAVLEEETVDFTGSDVGLHFEPRLDPVNPSTPSSVIFSAAFIENRVGLRVHKNVRVKVRRSRFMNALQPAIQLHAPNYTDLGGQQDLGYNLFQRRDNSSTALIMLCEQPLLNTPKIAAEGNFYPKCPSVSYAALAGECPITSSAADVVAYFPTAALPGEAAINGGCP